MEPHPTTQDTMTDQTPETPPEIPQTFIPTTSGSFEDFSRAVVARAFHHLADLDLDNDYLEKFALQFALRMDAILQKYRLGQLEHGGRLTDRDILHELCQEVDDILVYSLVLRSVQDRTIPVRI